MTGMPASMAFSAIGVSCRAVVGQDDDRVGLLVDERLDLRGLAVGVGGLDQPELDVVPLVGRLLRLRRDLAEPAVVGGRARWRRS